MYKNENRLVTWLCLFLLVGAWAVLGVGLHLLDLDREATADWEGYQVGWGILVPRILYWLAGANLLVVVVLGFVWTLPLLVVTTAALAGMGFSTLMWLDDSLSDMYRGFDTYPAITFWLSIAVVAISFVGFAVALARREEPSSAHP